MIDISQVQERWPTEHPDRLQLYSINSPNGIKVASMLEETGLIYEAHTINLFEGEQYDPAFVSISPNNKIPVLVDPQGPVGMPLRVMESCAILIYLADKTGRLMPQNQPARIECLQWLFFQTGHIGPMFGQFEHFHRRGDDNDQDPYALQRYETESRRLMGILETRLTGHDYIMGPRYSVADIATYPWVRSLRRMLGNDVLMAEFPHALRWHEACLARPASQVGMTVCAEER
jgi:GSH-dependent disulfide-bond oxidoreductase